MEDPSYSLQLKQTLTIKPLNFRIHAIPRSGKPKLLAMPSNTIRQTNEKVDISTPGPTEDSGRKPIYVLYGSNTGSCESFAQRIASDAAAHGESNIAYFPLQSLIVLTQDSTQLLELSTPLLATSPLVDLLS